MAKPKNSPAEKFEALLKRRSGSDGYLEHEMAGDEQTFVNEEPNANFRGFGGKVLYEVSLDERDDCAEERRLIERLPYGIAVTTLSINGSETYYVTGVFFPCKQDSAEEKAYVRAQVLSTLSDIASPLRFALQQAEERGLGLTTHEVGQLLAGILLQPPKDESVVA